MDNNTELGITYRHFVFGRDTLEIDWTLHKVHCYHHGTGDRFINHVAVLGYSTSILPLINRWNQQPESGWQYYV